MWQRSAQAVRDAAPAERVRHRQTDRSGARNQAVIGWRFCHEFQFFAGFELSVGNTCGFRQMAELWRCGIRGLRCRTSRFRWISTIERWASWLGGTSRNGATPPSYPFYYAVLGGFVFAERQSNFRGFAASRCSGQAIEIYSPYRLERTKRR